MSGQTVAQTGRAPAQALGAYSMPEHIREPLLRWEGLERYERLLASMAQTVALSPARIWRNEPNQTDSA